MGNGQSLTKDEIQKLQDGTHFDQKELKVMYKQFRKETSSGVISKEDFKTVLLGMGIQDQFLQDLVFNSFDRNKDNTINFQEFVTALSVMTRGDPQEKLEFAFNMYDLDGNGFIDKDEMVKIMESFYKVIGSFTTASGKKYENPKNFIEEFFDAMDTNKDGRISLQEYKEGALKNPDIVQGLKLFN